MLLVFELLEDEFEMVFDWPNDAELLTTLEKLNVARAAEPS